MDYAFEMKLFNLDIEVAGTFTTEEPQTLTYSGHPAEFDIKLVVHKGIEMIDLPDETYQQIGEYAFHSAKREYQP